VSSCQAPNDALCRCSVLSLRSVCRQPVGRGLIRPFCVVMTSSHKQLHEAGQRWEAPLETTPGRRRRRRRRRSVSWHLCRTGISPFGGACQLSGQLRRWSSRLSVNDRPDRQRCCFVVVRMRLDVVETRWLCERWDHSSASSDEAAATDGGFLRLRRIRRRRCSLVRSLLCYSDNVGSPATLAYSASYPLWDGKWVPAKVRWCAAAGGVKAGWLMDKRVDGRKSCVIPR